MRIPASLLLVAAAMSLPVIAQAHFVWASIDPSAKTLTVAFAETPSEEPLPLAARAPLVTTWSKTQKSIELRNDNRVLSAPFESDVVVASLDYGVVDRTKQGRGIFLLNYYAKGALTPEASQSTLGLPIELSLSVGADGRSTVLVRHNGAPLKGSEVVAKLPGIDEPVTLQTSSEGKAVLPTFQRGPVAIRAAFVENTKGAVAGKAYDLIRSYGTLTVRDPGAHGVLPFTRVLSVSFGDNHDVVSHTSFINTVLDGKLTKAQLEVHLQQRALIHSELHRILVSASASKHLPYGEAQKNVIVLLFTDLIDMDSFWPAEAQARPLTKAFLREIRDSAKKGPFFALGVWHVYYGGISNGGRFIGQKIGETLKFTPTYYLKNDGYIPYLEKVNEISDAVDQKEMIRGGQAAYRYIIASNNEKVFRSK